MALETIFFGLSLCLLAAVADAQIRTSFSCDGRVSGYYADVVTGCQVYHMCDGLGRKFSFVCPNATLFQQRMLICDHWFMVNCSRSESDYSANLLIGQKGQPFVGENGKSSFQRTPRPDYVSVDPDQNEAVYENNVEHSDDLNLVGINSDDNQTGSKQYNPPSRWSTEYKKISPTNDPKKQPPRRQDVGESHIVERTTTRTIADRLSNKYDTEVRDGNSEAISNPAVNFQSRYKATTPVYPTFVEESLKMKNIELAPPKPKPNVPVIDFINKLQIDESSSVIKEKSQPTHVNFESKFKATTPVYPTSVDDDFKINNVDLSPPVFHNEQEEVVNDKDQTLNVNNPVKVNFESNFKATTPVYPTSVDDALKQNNFELFPPQDGKSNKQEKIVKVNFVSNFEATTPVYPLSVEATSPIPDAVGLLPPLDDDLRHLQEATTRRTVNFESNFAATIPNYPLSVEATSPVPDVVGLLPPHKTDISGRLFNFVPGEEDDEQIRRKDDNPQDPSQYYEPPLFNTGYVNPNGALFNYRRNNKHVVIPKIDDWNELRKRFSVPAFDFPLDSDIRRANYESDLSSFQPRPAGLQQR